MPLPENFSQKNPSSKPKETERRAFWFSNQLNAMSFQAINKSFDLAMVPLPLLELKRDSRNVPQLQPLC
jgi:hypothetical protein